MVMEFYDCNFYQRPGPLPTPEGAPCPAPIPEPGPTPRPVLDFGPAPTHGGVLANVMPLSPARAVIFVDAL